MYHVHEDEMKTPNLKCSLLSLLQMSKTLSQILQIQSQLITTALITDPFASSHLLSSLTSQNNLSMKNAELLFTQIHQPNACMYNTMIRGYVHSSNPQKAFVFYVNMGINGVLRDKYTYPFVLKVCRLVEGREVHGEVLKRGFLCDVFVVNGLIAMYCRCAEMSLGRILFDELEGKDLVSWNLMLGAYVVLGPMETAQKLFDEMLQKDVASWSIMIDGYGKRVGDVTRARALFDSMPIRDLVSWNSMIRVYIHAGKLVAARQLFEEMQSRNVISWSIMIDGYASHGNSKEALNLFRQMLYEGIKPDKKCVVGAISACGQLGALEQGRWIHKYMKTRKILMDTVVCTALVDMYMKCGNVTEAHRIFDSMPEKSVISWNVMITGLGMNGFGKEALEYFTLMEKEGIPPDDLIFLGVLTTCRHAGLVFEGIRIFNQMKSYYRIEPKPEHFSCLIDLLTRAGQLKHALEVLEIAPANATSSLWSSLLMACQSYRNVDLAQVVMKRLGELNADDSAVYVTLSNIYADAGMWQDVREVRKLMKDRKMIKEVGSSAIEIDGKVEEFVSGCKCQELISVIQSLSRMIHFLQVNNTIQLR